MTNLRNINKSQCFQNTCQSWKIENISNRILFFISCCGKKNIVCNIFNVDILHVHVTYTIILRLVHTTYSYAKSLFITLLNSILLQYPVLHSSSWINYKEIVEVNKCVHVYFETVILRNFVLTEAFNTRLVFTGMSN